MDCDWHFVEITIWIVNSVSSVVRTLTEIRKKWTDMASLAKKKEASRRAEKKKTGGGAAPEEPTGTELKVVSLLADEAIDGVPGGVDTFDLPVFVLENTNCGNDLAVTQPSSLAVEQHAPAELSFPVDVVEQYLPVTSCSTDPAAQTIAGPLGVGEQHSTQREKRHNMDWLQALNPVVNFEKERLDIERDRLRLERERLEFEKMKWREFMAMEMERLEVDKKRLEKCKCH